MAKAYHRLPQKQNTLFSGEGEGFPGALSNTGLTGLTKLGIFDYQFPGFVPLYLIDPSGANIVAYSTGGTPSLVEGYLTPGYFGSTT